jgi:hypothetical protein
LYFSCKNYQELAQARITKVVGYCTVNPTKLVLHFYDFPVIFYAIYKKQEINLTIGVHLLQRGPWKDFYVCNVALGRSGRRRWEKSGELAGARGRGRTGEGSRGALGPVWALGRGGGGAGKRLVGGQRGAAAGGLLRRGEGRGEGVEGFGSFLRCLGSAKKG